MPTKEDRERETAAIYANHAIYQKQVAEIEMLRILLRQCKGQFVSIQEKWRTTYIAKRYPDFAYYLESMPCPPPATCSGSVSTPAEKLPHSW